MSIEPAISAGAVFSEDYIPTRSHVLNFLEICRDGNRLHVDDGFAQTQGFRCV